MTERLGTLLRDEATGLDVPPAPVEAILGAGRGLRRRRRTGRALTGLAGIAAVTVLAVGLVPMLTGNDPSAAQERYDNAAAAAAYGDYGAFAAGSTVYVGNNRVQVDGKVKAIYYTSEGVLVRTGKSAATDSAGPSHYTLVHPDGSTRGIDLRMGDRVPGTDPESRFVAYAEPHGKVDTAVTRVSTIKSWDLVSVDLATGKEAARTTVTGDFTWGGWEAPPVATADTRMWALFDEGWVEFDWSAGTTRVVPGTAGATIDAAHGIYATFASAGADTNWKVHDFRSGRVLADIPREGMDPENPWREESGWLSPDGRYVRMDSDATVFDDKGDVVEANSRSRFVSVETGRSVSLPGSAYIGWTPDGDALVVDAKHDRLKVCDPGTGHCDTIALRIGGGTVKVGGKPYES